MGIKIKNIFIFLFLSILISPSMAYSLYAPPTQPTQAELDYQKGLEYLDKGLYDLALREFQSVIKSDSTYRSAWRKIGDINLYLKDYSSAIEYYRIFIKLGGSKPDRDEKRALLDIAKIYKNHLGDINNAIRSLYGLLEHYYPDTFEPIERLLDIHHASYLQSVDLLEKNQPTGAYIDNIWQETILLLAKWLLNENRTKEAYEIYSRYHFLSRYKYKFINKDIPNEWVRLYLNNLSKAVPGDWLECPWVIILSPENPVYQSGLKDKRRFENAAKINESISNHNDWRYIFQAKPGYKFKKLELIADIDVLNYPYPGLGGHIFPFHYGGFAPPFKSSDKMNWPVYKNSGFQRINGLLEFSEGIRAIQLSFWSRTQNAITHQWQVRAEFIPDSDIKPNLSSTPEPHLLTICVSPMQDSTKIIWDDQTTKPNIIQWHFARRWPESGWRKLRIERPDVPAIEMDIYYDRNSSITHYFWMSKYWAQKTTDLKLPANTSDITLFRDKNNRYHLIIVASPDGYSNIYHAYSENLIHWSKVNKLAINSLRNDDFPRIFQEPNSGYYHLIWRSNRSAESTPYGFNDLFQSNSRDLLNWSRPQKILAIPRTHSSANIGINIYRELTGIYNIYFTGGVIRSDDALNWSKPMEINYSHPLKVMNYRYYHYYLPDGRHLLLCNDYQDKMLFFTSLNGIDFELIGRLNFPNNQLKHADFYQIIELQNGELGFIWDHSSMRYLSRSNDLINWSEPEVILPFYSGKIFSNIITDLNNRSIMIADNFLLISENL